MTRFDGLVAAVTGAGSGIGLATTEVLLRDGRASPPSTCSRRRRCRACCR